MTCTKYSSRNYENMWINVSSDWSEFSSIAALPQNVFQDATPQKPAGLQPGAGHPRNYPHPKFSK